jgi:hypothetical protein
MNEERAGKRDTDIKDRLASGISLLWNNHKDRLSDGIINVLPSWSCKSFTYMSWCRRGAEETPLWVTRK